jgi:hypothetical protein
MGNTRCRCGRTSRSRGKDPHGWGRHDHGRVFAGRTDRPSRVGNHRIRRDEIYLHEWGTYVVEIESCGFAGDRPPRVRKTWTANSGKNCARTDPRRVGNGHADGRWASRHVGVCDGLTLRCGEGSLVDLRCCFSVERILLFFARERRRFATSERLVCGGGSAAHIDGSGSGVVFLGWAAR